MESQAPQVQVFIPFRPDPAGVTAQRNMSDPKERFFRHFQAQIGGIQDRIDDLSTLSPVGGERKDCVDAVLASISRLSSEVLDAGEYIPAYDQRAYSQAIKGLTEKLNEATGKFAPKSRFQFKNRTSKVTTSKAAAQPSDDPRFHNPAANSSQTSAPEAAVATTDGEVDDSVGNLPSFPKNYNEELSRTTSQGVRKPSFSTAKEIAIHDHTGLHIMLPSSASRATSSGSLTNLYGCIVDMTIPTSSGTPFMGLALRDIKKSLIIAGHVAGAAHITGLHNSVVVVEARQVRIHECKNVDIYLHCSSHPIIEDCEEMRFAPIPEYYIKNSKGEHPTNQWDQVDDFKWLKNEPSPNWSVLPEEKRVLEEVWENTVRGNPSVSTNDILRKVGISNL